VTAQIIAFQVYKYGLLMIAIGFFTEVFAKRERVRQWGTALMGLGLLFFGMELMSIATGPIRGWPPFIELMQDMQNPLLAVAMGALFTAIVQSSSATTGIVIVLASQGLITLESGIGLLFGANIGTCITAVVSSIGRPREALQAAWVHVIFNVLGVLLWLAFIPQFADVVRTISPGGRDLAVDIPRQIANAHTVFNVANLFIFIWFTGPLARLVERLVPTPPVDKGIEPKYLDELYLSQPALALDQVRRELVRLGGLVASMIDRSLPAAISGSKQDAAALSKADDDVDKLYTEIIRYLSRLSQTALVSPQPQHLQNFVGIANYMENIGDVIEKDLLAIIDKRIRKGLVIGGSTIRELEALATAASEAFEQALQAVESGNPDDALDVLESKKEVAALADEATAHIATRLVADAPNRIENFQVETEIIETYKRFNTLTRRIARLAVEEHDNDAESTESEPLADH
jgi:phosphate:Na+ symporter